MTNCFSRKSVGGWCHLSLAPFPITTANPWDHEITMDSMNIFSLIIFKIFSSFLFFFLITRADVWKLALTYDFVLIKLKLPLERIETYMLRLKILLHRYLQLKILCMNRPLHTSSTFYINFRYFVLHSCVFFFSSRTGVGGKRISQ